MFINKLAEHCDLPPCFNAWCDCGWKGRRAYGAVYVPGSNVILDVPLSSDNKRCPRCKKIYYQAMALADFTARFQWVMGQSFKLPGRGDGSLFPCSCLHQPSMQLVGELTFYRSVLGDTCFGGIDYWMGITGQVKCCGCIAQGEVKIIDYYDARDVYEWFDDNYKNDILIYIPRAVPRSCEA